jgi:hypothetical protein
MPIDLYDKFTIDRRNGYLPVYLFLYALFVAGLIKYYYYRAKNV